MPIFRTIAETVMFQRQAAEVWTQDELMAFKTWLAVNPHSGDVIPGSGGVRKVRWMRPGTGKRGGARVIYFNEKQGRIWLLSVYVKAKFDTLPAAFLARLKQEVEDDEES